MSVINRALKPLKTAATAFFRRDLTLRRSERGLEIALAAKPGSPLSPAEQGERDRAEREARLLACVRDELAALLDEGSGTRRTMRALVLLEEGIERAGWKALDKVPLPVLKKALEQFEGLVSNWSPVGLATLRSKMAVALQHRERDEPTLQAKPGDDAPRHNSVAMLDSKQDIESAEINEVDLATAAQLAAAYPPLSLLASADATPAYGGPSLPHPQAPTAADDESAALAAAYAALGAQFDSAEVASR
ncbi:MAG: hypothetical protein LW768_14875 [Rubrivivax sp.]|nr:hypothetical protein [Rubrivivax sp.]